MYTLAVITLGFFLLFAILLGVGKREEITNNWQKYRAHPLYMMTAFLYKPAEDPQSRFEFMQDNFNAVMQQSTTAAFNAALAPIMDIFQLIKGGIVGSTKGIVSMQNILETLKDSFGQIFGVFNNRYTATLHRLAMTFQHLQTSLSRVWAIAVNSVYQSMATVSAILSTLDLIMKIVIIILTILVAIVLFLFLFLWPVIPVILGVLGILTTAGMGAAVGGMAGTFCFAGDTPVILADGTTKPIATVQIGDTLEDCGVTGSLEFLQDVRDLYDLHGIRVTGSHIVWHNGHPIPVAQHPNAQPLPPQTMRLYCLNTTTNRIPVYSTVGTLVFSDWEELGDEDQAAWNRHVYTELNPGASCMPAAVSGEAGHSPTTLVQTEHGPVPISDLRPGDTVLDATGRPTRVLGSVKLAEANPAAVWRLADGLWQQGSEGEGECNETSTGAWYSLVTEAGTFCTTQPVRDFTDVGITRIQATYGWVLEALDRKNRPVS